MTEKSYFFITVYAVIKGVATGLFFRDENKLTLFDYKIINQLSLEKTKLIISDWSKNRDIYKICCNNEYFKKNIPNTALQKIEDKENDFTELVVKINDEYLEIYKNIKKDINRELENFDINVESSTIGMMILGIKYKKSCSFAFDSLEYGYDNLNTF